MPVSIDYVTRETASNLWRNRLMTIAAVLTVAVSLALAGSALLLRQGVAQATTKWQHGVNVLVFLRPGDSLAQQDSTRQQLVALPYVRTCFYRSQQYDYSEARQLLPADESQALTVASMPSSLRCALQDPRQAQAVFDQFHGLPGVQAVSYPSQAVRNMEQVTKILQIVFFVVAGILLLSAMVLILNTIRLAIFARRREVSVMKIVGATNWFIRVPFMCEGMIQGVLGALVAASVVILLHFLLDHFAGHNQVLYQMRMPNSQVIVTNLMVVFVGIIVGTLGSAFAIRRFLEA